MIKEHDLVVLTQDLPEEGLRSGDVGTVVHIHEGGRGYEMEFMTLSGKTVAVATVMASQVRPVSSRDPRSRARTTGRGTSVAAAARAGHRGHS